MRKSRLFGKKYAVRSYVWLLVMPVFSIFSGCSSEQTAQLVKGEHIYTSTCKVCHAQGINGAPILGNQKMWSKRMGQGVPTLVEHAANGYGLMPAKGGNASLTNDDLGLAIRYMLSRLDQNK